MQCGVPTRTTPTLTPTTLRSIEQTIEEISQFEPPEAHTNQAGFVPPLVNTASASTTFISLDKNNWGGGFATISRVSEPSTTSVVTTQQTTKPLQLTSFVPGESGIVLDSSTIKSSKPFVHFDESSSGSNSSSCSSSNQSLISQTSATIYTPVLTSGSTTIITPAVTPAPAILAAQVQNGRRMGGRRPMREEKVS